MPWKIATEPSDEPVTLAEAKEQCNVTDFSGDDTYISGLITAARAHLETVCSRAFVTQTVDVYFDRFPSDAKSLQIPRGSLQSVSVFEWFDTDGVSHPWTVSSGNLMDGSTVMAHIDSVSEPARIVLADGQNWPSDSLRTVNAIHVRIVCGYGLAEAVPRALKQAVLLLVAHWYANREAVVLGNTSAVVSAPLAMALDSIIANYRL